MIILQNFMNRATRIQQNTLASKIIVDSVKGIIKMRLQEISLVGSTQIERLQASGCFLLGYWWLVPRTMYWGWIDYVPSEMVRINLWYWKLCKTILVWKEIKRIFIFDLIRSHAKETYEKIDGAEVMLMTSWSTWICAYEVSTPKDYDWRRKTLKIEAEKFGESND